MKGICEHCKGNFDYELTHNGFNESSYAYCDQCGKTAYFSTYKVPSDLSASFEKKSRHKVIDKGLEKNIEECACGGHFRHDASPRCPHCHEELSPINAKEYFESNSNSEDWSWQNNWIDIYSIIINGNVVDDNWKKFSSSKEPGAK